MSLYSQDRGFTDFVHENLAVPIIYNSMDWSVKNIAPTELEKLDINKGVDYVITDGNGMVATVPERFRDNFYSKYNDATLRFRRDFNPNPSRVESEFYKIEADYLVYGITNGKKFIDKRHTLSDFVKWVVLDLRFIQNKYKSKELVIVSDNKITCWADKGVLYCPENFNPDRSSSFIPFDVPLMFSLWGMGPIVKQKGFL